MIVSAACSLVRPDFALTYVTGVDCINISIAWYSRLGMVGNAYSSFARSVPVVALWVCREQGESSWSCSIVTRSSTTGLLHSRCRWKRYACKIHSSRRYASFIEATSNNIRRPNPQDAELKNDAYHACRCTDLTLFLPATSPCSLVPILVQLINQAILVICPSAPGASSAISRQMIVALSPRQ